MGSMLQALKNLEARSAWPDARKSVLAHLAADAPPAPPHVPAAAAPPPPPLPTPTPLPTAISAEMPVSYFRHWQLDRPSVVVESSPLVDGAAYAPVFVAPAPPLEEPSPAAVTPEYLAIPSTPAIGAAPPVPASQAPAIATPVARLPVARLPVATRAVRTPVGLELAVRRALGEPHRRQPIRELANRLRQDAQETGSRTLLFVGIGAASATHEAVLHVAALLADEGGRVLLVDGDSARRPLSLDFDAVQHAGLSDLLVPHESTRELLQPTSFAGLTFLPAGTQRLADLTSAADRWSRGLGELSNDFDLTLIDGGRTGDPAVAALARLADATYVVVQLGVVEASAAQAALRDLRASGARVLGCIATE